MTEPPDTYVFADASMPASTKWLINTVCAFTDDTVTVINLISTAEILLQSQRSLTVGVCPTVRVPFIGVMPNALVDLSKCGGGDGSVSFGDDVVTVFRRSSEGSGNNHVRDNRTLQGIFKLRLVEREVTNHDGVDGGMQTESFTNDTV